MSKLQLNEAEVTGCYSVDKNMVDGECAMGVVCGMTPSAERTDR